MAPGGAPPHLSHGSEAPSSVIPAKQAVSKDPIRESATAPEIVIPATRRESRRGGAGKRRVGTPPGPLDSRRGNDPGLSCPEVRVFPRKRESRGGGGVLQRLSPLHPAWIPAFAGMTISGVCASLGWRFDTACFAGMTEGGGSDGGGCALTTPGGRWPFRKTWVSLEMMINARVQAGHKPPWLKVRLPSGAGYNRLKDNFPRVELCTRCAKRRAVPIWPSAGSPAPPPS